MSIFSTILSTIFPSSHPAVVATAAPTPAAASSTVVPSVSPVAAPAPPPVDVEAVLTDLAAKNGQTLNWQSSIVDLMKLLGLDSSLAHRKELAAELHYSCDTNDSAAMNIWLQKLVMTKLAENGAKVPDSLKA